MPRKKTTTITSPATRLPRQRGEFVMTPERPGPIRPKIRPNRPITSSPSVEITNPAALDR